MLLLIPQVQATVARNVTVADADFEAVYGRAKPWYKLLLLLGRDAGLRAATAQRLTASEVQEGGRIIRTRTKGGSQTTVPVTERLRGHLLYAVQVANPGQSLVEAMLGEPIKDRQRACAELRRLRRETGCKSRWTFHDLRRTAARAVYARTGDLRKVQAFLGHAHLQQSLWYLSDPAVEVALEDLGEERNTA